MEYRNPIFTDDGSIDCEVNHPQFGWIPFTASANDPEEHGAALFAEINARHQDVSDALQVEEYVAPEPPPAPDAKGATPNQLLDEFESRPNSSGTGDLEDELFVLLSEKEQRRFLGSQFIPKDHQRVQAFLTAQGYTAEQITDIFNSAAAR